MSQRDVWRQDKRCGSSAFWGDACHWLVSAETDSEAGGCDDRSAEKAVDEHVKD